MKFFIKYSLFIFFLIFNFSATADENKIVIKVNDKIVSFYEVKNKVNTELVLRNLEMNQLNIDKLKSLALQELINFRIKENEISKYKNINIEKMDITNQLNSISSNDVNKLKQKFLDNNLNYDIFIKELKIQASWQRLIFLLFRDKVKINENEIINEIKDLKSNITEIKEYDLSELEFSIENPAKKKEKIEEIQKNIIEMGFEKTVSIFSDSETAINKGRLGFVNEKSLSKEIYVKLKDLSEGEITEPIVMLDKIIFLKINEIKIKKNDDLNIELLKKRIIDKKKNYMFNLYSKSYLSKLKNTSYIEFK